VRSRTQLFGRLNGRAEAVTTSTTVIPCSRTPRGSGEILASV